MIWKNEKKCLSHRSCHRFYKHQRVWLINKRDQLLYSPLLLRITTIIIISPHLMYPYSRNCNYLLLCKFSSHCTFFPIFNTQYRMVQSRQSAQKKFLEALLEKLIISNDNCNHGNKSVCNGQCPTTFLKNLLLSDLRLRS